MKDNMDKNIKNYFKKEISKKKTPPFPDITIEKKKKFKWDYLFLAACIFSSLFLIFDPSSYNSQIRKSYIPKSKYEAFKNEIPRVIFEASLYFKNK